MNRKLIATQLISLGKMITLSKLILEKFFFFFLNEGEVTTACLLLCFKFSADQPNCMRIMACSSLINNPL